MNRLVTPERPEMIAGLHRLLSEFSSQKESDPNRIAEAVVSYILKNTNNGEDVQRVVKTFREAQVSLDLPSADYMMEIIWKLAMLVKCRELELQKPQRAQRQRSAVAEDIYRSLVAALPGEPDTQSL